MGLRRPPAPSPHNRNLTYWLGLPSSLEESFVGRGADLDALAVDFEGHRVVVISGGAGTGKSRLAAEYSRRVGVDGFWTSAGLNAIQTLAALAPSLGIPGEGSDADTAKEVQRSLAELAPETLWVVDNVDSLNLVNELATASVRLLVTTRDERRQLLHPGIAFRYLGVLERRAAVGLLCSRSEADPEDPILSEIAEAMGRLPLALEMLAVRLGEYNQSGARLWEEIQQTPTPLELRAFAEEAEGASIHRAEGVFAAIAGTLRDLSEDIREYLSSLGYVADAPVSAPLLAALTGLGEEGVGRLVSECRRRSVMSVVGTQIVVHALTIAAIAATNEKGIPATTIFRANARLSSIVLADPRALRLEIAHYQHILEQTRNIIGPEAAAVLSFANNLAIGYYGLGRNQEAVLLHEGTLRIREQVLGPEHPDTLQSRSNLAIGYRVLGRYEEAVRLDEETLRIFERVRGPEHPVTLTSRGSLANSYYYLLRYEEAVRLYDETLSIRERVLGPEHPGTLTSRNSLASGYFALGRYEEAVRLSEENLSIGERVLGPEHPTTLFSRNNLAAGYRLLGRYEEAVRLDEETLSIRERVLGPEHPDTLVSGSNLAIGYRDLGRYEEAVRLDEETLSIRERVLGPEHPNTLTSRNNLAIGYYALGRYEESVRLHEETLRIRERVLGPEHPRTLESRHNLAGGYRAVGRNREADELESWVEKR